MPLEVIGAGFGRTGTLSLKYALERLGIAFCYHMLELREHPEHLEQWQRAVDGAEPDWEQLFEGYRAAVDWPACSFWRQYVELYPDARVVLSLRDPDAWYDSVQSTIYPSSTGRLDSADADHRSRSEFQKRLIWDGTFDGRFDDRAHAIAVFNAHNDEVIAGVPAERLLVIEPGAGWEPLCRFLELPVPDEPYPNTNSRAEFAQRWK